MSLLDDKKEVLRWAQLKIVRGGQRRYWTAVERRLKAEIADLEKTNG